jgi:hypothetical protein
MQNKVKNTFLSKDIHNSRWRKELFASRKKDELVTYCLIMFLVKNNFNNKKISCFKFEISFVEM